MATLTESTRKRIRQGMGKRTTGDAIIAIVEGKTGTLTAAQQHDVEAALTKKNRASEFITVLHAYSGGGSISQATVRALQRWLVSATATTELLTAMS